MPSTPVTIEEFVITVTDELRKEMIARCGGQLPSKLAHRIPVIIKDNEQAIREKFNSNTAATVVAKMLMQPANSGVRFEPTPSARR